MRGGFVAKPHFVDYLNAGFKLLLPTLQLVEIGVPQNLPVLCATPIRTSSVQPVFVWASSIL